MVLVRVFNQAGELVGPVDLPKVELTEAEWRAKLSPEQFRILRTQGTERPFCGTLLDNKQHGVYTCAGCGLPLFSSQGKFNSGTGWPSFFQPIARENVTQRSDSSHGMLRAEILCARCDGHLGHVFDDGPAPTGLRFCLNSESLLFTEESQLAKLADPAATTTHSASTAVAYLAGGCFWCTEAAFEQLRGVVDVSSGYAGGAQATATYKQVCSGTTGHAEVIRITYQPSVISYDQLLEVFFDAHDPTQLNRQGGDVGTQYRSAIFYTSETEQQAAQQKIAQLTQARKFSQPIVTSLEPLKEFFPAEDYHQDYARLNPEQPYIQSHALPNACKVRAKHTGLMRP
jgi:peptide methionine sulfoxide reductase msrA/msrB